MAKNTFKSNTFKKKTTEKKFSVKTGLFSDRKFHLAVGFFLMIVSFFLFTSFISYLFTHEADQSVVDGISQTPVTDSGQEAENWFGLAGAVVSNAFIFKWFGLASFLFPPFIFLLSFEIIFRQSIYSLMRSFYIMIFFLFWISTLLGYLVFSSETVNEWGFLSGGIGYEISFFLDSLMGWGTYLLLSFLLIVFIIFFFNITSIFLFRTAPAVNPGYMNGENVLINGNLAGPELWEEEKEDDAELVSAMEDGKHEAENEIEVEDSLSGEKKTLELDIEENPEPVQEEPAFFVAEPAKEAVSTKLENYDPTLDLPKYKYPTIDLLNEYNASKVQVTKEELEQNKDRIIETLVNFKIGISSIKATIGPTVTLYEIVPEAGIKISKIKNLEDDIALSLSALGIRIIAPIPGKGTIGIEVPNKNREMVDMRSVIATEKFMKSDKELPVALGKTISNELYVVDLTKMPHLLMAGATGQGKSVGLNVILTSLIYKKHPSQLKFVLVDPKKVELTLFNKIERHFLAKLPNHEEAIVTDTKRVVETLNSLCIEMDQRYDLLKEAGTRNIKEYNQKFVNRKLNPQKGHRFLPYIVLVVDELADLMMTAGKEVEGPIARLAQLARAIGIHLVIATQRPSVNVITGLIKANFPARLSFKVTSRVDSKIILDTGGAEQLVGMGDMLLSQGSEINRLQSPYVDTSEVETICEFIGSQRGYDDAYQLPEFIGDEGGDNISDVDLSERDALFEDAARIIVLHQQGSTSLIQRKLKLGYNRAGRLIDQLEAAGVVGPFEGSKAREVLIPDEYSLEQLLSNLDEKN
jgi:S-DNA-T family DNA segregation ATPase FtsK/SpoIIIE